MKKRFVWWKNIVRGGVLFSLLLITSCENFFNGADLRKEIEDQVALANAPYFQILLEGSRGKFSPAKGQYQLKVTQSMDISFESDTDFAFIRWEVFNALTGRTLESSEYIEIADPNSDETSIKLLKEPAPGLSLGIRSIVSARPQIISYTPSVLGMLKDSTIQVLFNRDMDPDSIYYSKNERDELKKTEGLSDNDFIPTTVGGETKYYGYTKDEKKFYKNIMLTNNKTGENINDRFGIPVFESPRTLSISASKDARYILDDYTQVLVELEKGFFYTEQKKPVEMAGSKMWMYQVNDKTDDKPLVITKSGGNDLFFVKVDEATQILKSASFTTDQSGFGSLRFTDDGKLSLDIKVQEQDGGSGPNSFFTVNVKKLYGENYAALDQHIEKSFTVDFQNVTSDNGVFKGSVDLKKEGVPLGDGVYEMNFEFKDRSNNSMTYPSGENFYFAVDTKAPEISTPTIKSENSTAYTFECNSVIDIADAQIVYSKDGTAMTPVIMEKDSGTGKYKGEIPSVAKNAVYDIKIKYTDYAGHTSEENVPKFLTDFELAGTPNFTGTNASHVENIFFVGDKISDYGIVAKKYYSDGGSVDVNSNYSVPTRVTYNSSWSLSYTYSEGNISKSPVVSGTYYIAKKDALTQAPTFYQSSSGTWYCKFGDYPQDVSVISSYTSSPVYNGWYLGSNGYFYEKCHTNISGLAKTRAGGTLTNDADRYFKVQPIEWRLASGSYNGKRLLIAKMNLDGVQYYTSTSNRSVNGTTIKPNNYEYSTLRAFLNGK